MKSDTITQAEVSKRIPESALLAAALAWLKLVGVVCWRQNSGQAVFGGRRVKMNGADGISDICGILPGGRFLAIECKRRGKKAKPNQVAFMECVNRQGGLAFEADNLDDVCLKVQGAMNGGAG